MNSIISSQILAKQDPSNLSNEGVAISFVSRRKRDNLKPNKSARNKIYKDNYNYLTSVINEKEAI